MAGDGLGTGVGASVGDNVGLVVVGAGLGDGVGAPVGTAVGDGVGSVVTLTQAAFVAMTLAGQSQTWRRESKRPRHNTVTRAQHQDYRHQPITTRWAWVTK